MTDLQAREYERKKARERAYYEEERRDGIVARVLHSRVFFDAGRIESNYAFAKRETAAFVSRKLGRKKVDRLLIAPCGVGGDAGVLASCADEIHGIDLSPVAVAQCPPSMKAKVGDILDSGYPGESFDLVASLLFFHHVRQVGFDPFLEEFRRVTKRGGGIVILEPSLWYPLNLVTRPLKHLFGNPFGEVEDEGPFSPSLLLRALRRTGFVNVTMRPASFSHCAFYAPVAKAVNRITRPLLDSRRLAYLSWMTLFWAEKG